MGCAEGAAGVALPAVEEILVKLDPVDGEDIERGRSDRAMGLGIGFRIDGGCAAAGSVAGAGAAVRGDAVDEEGEDAE